MMKIIIRSGSHDDPTAPPGGGPERDPSDIASRRVDLLPHAHDRVPREETWSDTSSSARLNTASDDGTRRRSRRCAWVRPSPTNRRDPWALRSTRWHLSHPAEVSV